mgnify:CR=1 FL=1
MDDLLVSETRQLYPYQREAVETLFERIKALPPHTNLLFQLPTGGGKTIIFSEIARRYMVEYQKKVLI